MNKILIAAILVLAVTAHFDEIEESGRVGEAVKTGYERFAPKVKELARKGYETVVPHVKDIAREVAPVLKEAVINKLKSEIGKRLQLSEVEESGRFTDLVKTGVQKLSPHVKEMAKDVAPVLRQAVINKLKSELSKKLQFTEEEDVEESGRIGDLIKSGVQKITPHIKEIAREVAPVLKEAAINKIKSELNKKLQFTEEVEESGVRDVVKAGYERFAPHVKDLAREVAPVLKDAVVKKLKEEIQRRMQFVEEQVEESGPIFREPLKSGRNEYKLKKQYELLDRLSFDRVSDKLNKGPNMHKKLSDLSKKFQFTEEDVEESGVGDLVRAGVQRVAPHVKDIAREVAPIAKQALINKIKSEVAKKLQFIEEVEESGRIGDFVKTIGREVAPIAKEALVNKIKSEVNKRLQFSEEETEESGIRDAIKSGIQKIAPHVKDIAREVAPVAKQALINKLKSEANKRLQFTEEVEESGRVTDAVKAGYERFAPKVKELAKKGYETVVPHVKDIAREVTPVLKEAVIKKLKEEINKRIQMSEEDIEEAGRIGDFVKKVSPHVKDIARQVAPIAKEALINKIKSEVSKKLQFVEEVEESGRLSDLIKKGGKAVLPIAKEIGREVAPIAKEALKNKINSEINKRFQFVEEVEESQRVEWWNNFNRRVSNETRTNPLRNWRFEEVEESQNLGRRMMTGPYVRRNKTLDREEKYGKFQNPRDKMLKDIKKNNKKDGKKGQQEGKGWWSRMMPSWFKNSNKNSTRTDGRVNKPFRPNRPTMPRRPRWNFTNI